MPKFVDAHQLEYAISLIMDQLGNARTERAMIEGEYSQAHKRLMGTGLAPIMTRHHQAGNMVYSLEHVVSELREAIAFYGETHDQDGE